MRVTRRSRPRRVQEQHSCDRPTLPPYALHDRPRPPVASVQAFYHVACMGNWREVFAEQMDVFDQVGLKPMCFVLGGDSDRQFIEQRATVLGNQPNLGWYETPTLDELHKWCYSNLDCGVLYCHTKGVSKPWNTSASDWRRHMTDRVIDQWRTNSEYLAEYDVVGTAFSTYVGMFHFQGNFWMARADWCARLDPPWMHRDNHIGRGWFRSGKRFHAECWLMSKNYYHHKEV